MPSELTSSIGRFGLIAAGRLRLRSDRRGGRRAARRLPVRLQRTEDRGAAPWRPRGSSSSAYGGVIPVGFGVQKVAGAMIWATDIDEDKNTRKEGGSLFGGGQKIVEYRYFANFAVAFGEGPAGGVLRIWAGDRLIADLRAGAGAYANHPKYRFRIYLGTEDQEPDRLIRQHVENSDDFDGERRDAGVPGPGLHRVRGSAARRVRQPHPADHRGDRLGGRAAGGGQGHDVPVGGRLFHQQCGPRSGAGVSLFQDVAGRDWSHSHLRHGRGPAGARDRARHRPGRCEGDRQPGRPLRHARHHRAVIPQDRRRHAPGRRQRELLEPGRAGDRQRLHADRPDRLRAGAGVPFRPGADLLRRRPLRVLAGTERLHPPGRRGRWPQRLRLRARPGSRGRPRSCWARRPPRSASCTSGWSCRSRSARSPAFPRP